MEFLLLNAGKDNNWSSMAATKIIKSIEIKNNLPSSIFKVTKGSKDLKNFNKLNLAKDFAEETYAEKLSKKDSKN